jgi:hypothetical protein
MIVSALNLDPNVLMVYDTDLLGDRAYEFYDWHFRGAKEKDKPDWVKFKVK